MFCRRLPLIVPIAALCFAFALPAAARAEAPAVIATIKPVHGLVAGIMAGVGTPHLLIEGAGSPHAFALRPSDARRLQDARVVFWIGPAMETFLARPLRALARRARVVALMEASGVRRLPARRAGVHDDAHGHEDPHAHAGIDAHIWLDPRNAIAMTHAIADTLAAADPANTATYRANALAQEARLTSLDQALAARLTRLAGRSYVVFHDAYQYLEKRYGLRPAAAITVAPDRAPGARRLEAIRGAIRRTGAACVFIEPQFAPRIAAVVTEGTGARTAVLDPLGADLAPGARAYDALMTRLVESLEGCLAP